LISLLENHFTKTVGFNCFACSPTHPFGLRMQFYYDDIENEVFTNIKLNNLYAGFPGILHGGIQSTILDEVAFWGTCARYKRNGFTYDMKIKFRKKCPVEKRLEARGKIGCLQKRIVTSHTFLWDPDSKLIYTEGTVRYFLSSEKL